MDAGNRYYREDEREYVALLVECDLLTAPILYEAPGAFFPHIYGPLDTRAVREVRRVDRDLAGKFVSLGPCV
jgi:uncharacterized protein (DUF952 family)